jgi:transposase
MKNTLYLGLDVHKDSITIAIAMGGRNGEVRLYGTISNDLHALEKALRKIRQAHGGARLEVCYEAGPCGFGIARRLAQLKVACMVVAPSMIPKRSGDRVKTDKRDARKLARLLRAGELTAIYIPEPTDEAMRDLCRARTDAVDDRRRSRHRLKGFLLRHGYRYQGKSAGRLRSASVFVFCFGRIPGLAPPVDRRWSGLIMESVKRTAGRRSLDRLVR